jgi:hypothetical protein
MTRHLAKGHIARHKIDFISPTCVECGGQGKMASGESLFPKRPERHGRMFFACVCGAWVSCHKGTAIPAGRPGSDATRKLRHLAHEALDALWRRDGSTPVATGHARAKAYKWLSRELGLPERQTHLGWMGPDHLRRVIELCSAKRRAA